MADVKDGEMVKDPMTGAWRQVQSTYGQNPLFPGFTVIPTALGHIDKNSGANMATTKMLTEPMEVNVIDVNTGASHKVTMGAVAKTQERVPESVNAFVSASSSGTDLPGFPLAAMLKVEEAPEPAAPRGAAPEDVTPRNIVKFHLSPLNPKFAFHKVIISGMNLILVFDKRCTSVAPPDLEPIEGDATLTISLPEHGYTMVCQYFDQRFNLVYANMNLDVYVLVITEFTQKPENAKGSA